MQPAAASGTFIAHESAQPQRDAGSIQLDRHQAQQQHVQPWQKTRQQGKGMQCQTVSHPPGNQPGQPPGTPDQARPDPQGVGLTHTTLTAVHTHGGREREADDPEGEKAQWRSINS